MGLECSIDAVRGHEMYISIITKSLGGPSLNFCQLALQEELQAFLESLDSFALVGARSQGIKKSLNQFGAAGEKARHPFLWTASAPLAETSSLSHDPNFRATAKMECSVCKSPSILYVHLAVGNREGIGTNFLRSNLAGACEFGAGRLVLITLGRDLLNVGGWDSSYGDSEEFLAQFRLGYKEAISPPPVIMELNSPPLR